MQQEQLRKLRIVKDLLIPIVTVRIAFFLTIFITWPIYSIFRLKRFLKKIKNPDDSAQTKLCLEAGAKGWEIIEYKELYQSAIEYLGDDHLVKLVVDKNKSYPEQIKQAIQEYDVTHYGWSPRTGNQHWFLGLIEALKISMIFSFYGVVPIVFLTDVLDRNWRIKASMVTAAAGRVVILNAPDGVRLLIPHRRFIGPYLMPFSQETLDSLSAKKEVINQNHADVGVKVVGALYEPRKTIVETVDKILYEKYGGNIIFKGRSLDGVRSTDEEYWQNMLNAKIVLTTSNVVNTLKGYDWDWKEHFVYRYLECLACGTLLIAPDLPAITRYFTSGTHFVSFETEEEAAEKINYYLENEKERLKIAAQGYKRTIDLINARSFWLGIDIALADEGLTR